VNFVEICNVYVGKMIIKAAKRIFNSDKICRSYSDLNFGVTFFGTQCILSYLGYVQNYPGESPYVGHISDVKLYFVGRALF